MALTGDVKVPLVGKVPKKAAAGGVAVVGVLVVVYYVRQRKAASAASATAGATTTDQYPPDGTTGNPADPYSTDPATGQTYGDEAAGSGGTFGAYGGIGTGGVDSGSFPWDGSTGNPGDPYSLDPGTGVTYGSEGGGSGSGTGSGGPPFPSNSAWETWVINQLQIQDPAIDTGGLTTALGLYLNGQPVSAAEKTLIFDATAAGGNPPIAGPNNYPPNVRTNGTKGGGGATVTVPNVVDQPQEAAYAILSEAGLKPEGSKVIPGQVIYVATQTPAAGKKVAHGSVVKLVSKPKTTGYKPGGKPPIITPGR